MLYSSKNTDDSENLRKLAPLQRQTKVLRLQDKLGTQKFHYEVKEIFEPVTDTVKQTAQQTIGAVRGKANANALKTENVNKVINEKQNLIKYEIFFDLRLVEYQSEVAKAKKSNFDCVSILIEKTSK